MKSRKKNSVPDSDRDDLQAELEELRSVNRKLEERCRELEGSLETVRSCTNDTDIVYPDDTRKIQTSGDVHRTADRTLQETKEYLESLITYANAPIIVWDPEFRITRFNHAFERLTGRSAEDLIGQDLGILFPEETRNQSMEQILKTLAGERFEVTEIPIQHRDGTVRTVIWNSATIFDQDSGMVTATIAQGQDITDRKAAEEKILHLASFPEMNPMPVIELDWQGQLTFCNKATHTILQSLGLPDDPYRFVPPEIGTILRDSGRGTSRNFRFEVPIGEATFIENLYVEPAMGTVRIYANDITTLRNTANELKQYAEKLARSNRELEQFAYVASHDLREPLRMVTSFSQLLQHRYQGRLDPDADEFISYIVDGATRMDKLIQDLLEFSRVSSRAQPFEPTEMNGVVREVRRNLAVIIHESGARITTDILPVVTADRSQMVLLFQNLVDNAIKYRCGENPSIHIGAEQSNKEWTFSVRDNGIGIDPAYRERIFEIFQRLHSREEYPGTGIGLAICRRIIERHNGTIWVESEIGKGSTFLFTIPCTAAVSQAGEKR